MEETKEVGVVSGPTAHPDAQFAVWAAKNDTHKILDDISSHL
jgi:hypothetical protein